MTDRNENASPESRSGRGEGVWCGRRPGSRLSKDNTCRLGGYRWRRSRGLHVVSDYVRIYRARREPRGPYGTPMPADLLPGWDRAA